MTPVTPTTPMQSGATGRRRGVQSIDRAVTILRCFDTAHPELGISDLARRTGLSTSTTHRLLSALQENGLVRQSRDRRYALGPLLLRLARVGAAPASVLDAARPVMIRLRDEVDETVGLHVLLPTYERAVIDQVESRQPLRRTYTEFGAPIPLPLGAPGKVLLAALPYDVQEAVLARPVTARTTPPGTSSGNSPGNPAEPDVLRKQLVGIRRGNVAFSRAERTSGIRTVATAVFDGADRPVASLSVSAPAGRMPEERMEEYAPLVVAAAWSISEQLGATREGVAAYLTRAEPPPA